LATVTKTGFNIDIEACQKCQGPDCIIACVEDAAAINLNHLAAKKTNVEQKATLTSLQTFGKKGVDRVFLPNTVNTTRTLPCREQHDCGPRTRGVNDE